MAPLGSLVDGELIVGCEARVINPATGEPFATYGVADAALIERAVASASKAFLSWRDTPVAVRREVLVRMADRIHDNAENLARLLTLEQGKIAAEAQEEVAWTEAIFRHYAALYPEADKTLFREEGKTYVRLYTSLGVVAGIVPWNFPFLIMATKVAPALLTGNVIIVKPAPTTPLTTLKFAQLIAQDVPPGVVQVLGDDGTVGPALVSHPMVRKVAFTGSTVSGRKVMAAGAETLKRLTLELGGNDPAIVLDDADPETSAAGIFAAAFTNAGQVCGAAKRLYVHERVYDAFIDALRTRVERIVLGSGQDPAVTMGPVQNRMQFERANTLTQAARSGQILAQAPAFDGPGYFIRPTVFGGLAEDHPLVAQEQFAPLLPILRYTDLNEAIARANATPFGLTASIWTADEARGEQVVRKLEAGLLCVNKHNEAPGAAVGIAAAKQSGIGWLFGEEGVREYLQPHLLYRG